MVRRLQGRADLPLSIYDNLGIVEIVACFCYLACLDQLIACP